MLKAVSVELWKMFHGMKLYILCGILVLMSLMIALSMIVSNSPASSVPINGQSFPILLLGSIGKDIVPILMVIASAGLLSDELRNGTLKGLLVRPVTRLEVLAGKAGALLVYILLFLMVTLISGYGWGLLFFGWGKGFIPPIAPVSAGIGIVRTIGAYALTVLPLFGFGAVVLLLSQWLISSNAVIALSLGLFLGMQLASRLVERIRFALISEHFAVGIGWLDGTGSRIGVSIMVSVLYILFLSAISAVSIRSKDILY